MNPITLPSAGGDYALLIHINEPLKIKPGCLGNVHLPSGWALYFGSARGPGGLKARLARHIKPASQKRTHWHIDYLTASAPVEEIWFGNFSRRQECRWAKMATRIGKPVNSFGASDCSCRSHLFSFGSRQQVQQVWKALQKDCNGNLQQIVMLEETIPWREKSPSRQAKSKSGRH